MELNETKYGFKLKSIREIKDLSSTLYEYEHLKSGATVVYLENEDTNCVFGIGFRTLPKDSTGVCHIIEHSVLCGSEKYPLKEPFVNLIKSSMATFLNAFTASDWTMYPVASQTPKDFDNLISVYCDAVYRPLSVLDPKPFLQEGWHLELLSEDALPSYKGVVYNEMKGAMSSVDRILEQETVNVLYKDNCYGVNSGGEPRNIPDLTYDAYKAFYHEHYTPENALTYFYGKMDIDAKLKTLDEEYYSKYTRTNKKIEVKPQKPHINLDKTIEYAIGEDESEKDNTFISLAFVLDKYENKKEFTAWQILDGALLSSNDSPLKKALLDAHIGQNVETRLDDDNLQPSLYIALQKTNPKNKEKFREVFFDAVKELVKNGIDKKLLTATLNRMEFKSKELDTGGFPKGILLLINLQQAFNYYLDLESALSFQRIYDDLREEIKTDYFEKLLDKYLLNSKHYAQVVALPNKDLTRINNEKMEALMKEKKEKMSKEEIKALVKQTKELLAYQNKMDTKKELATLPSLSLRDIPSTVNYLDTKKVNVNGKKGFYHLVPTNKIAYLNLYFDLRVLKEEELPYLALLVRLLHHVPTTKYDALELNNEIKTYLGNLSFGWTVTSQGKDDFALYLKVNASALASNASHISELLNEILFHSRFSKQKVQLILKQMVQSNRTGIIEAGNSAASMKARSNYSKEGYLINNSLGGIDFYKALAKMAEEGNYQEIIAKLKDISKRVFTKKNLLFSISGENEELECLKNVIKDIKLPRKEVVYQLDVNVSKKEDSALAIPSSVNYDAVATNLERFGLKRRGQDAVVAHIVNYDYLWSEVRVKGGAYGVGLRFLANNDVVYSSYRDPNVLSTYSAFEGIKDYLKNFKISKKEFNNYIIGAVGSFDTPVSTPSLINAIDLLYLNGKTKKDRIQFKKEMLHTKIEDMYAAADLFEKILKDRSNYTVGNKDKISEAKLFDKIENL